MSETPQAVGIRLPLAHVPTMAEHQDLMGRVSALERAIAALADRLAPLEAAPELHPGRLPVLAPVDSDAEEAARALVDSMTEEERADLRTKLAAKDPPQAGHDGTIEPLPRLALPSDPEQRARVGSLYYAAEEEAAHCVRGSCCQDYEPTPGEARKAQEGASALLSLVFKLADREAVNGNGPGWLVWARVWCGLLLLRDAAEGWAPTPGARGEPSEEEDRPGVDLMRAILGVDGDDGRPDIPEMAARLYG